MTAIRPAPSQPAKPGVVLAMLLLVYVFNFVDRQILAILAGPIQYDLNLFDSQMGLLGGVAFALLYSTLGVPLAWVADRTSRSWVIAVSLTLWSGFTALCGLAQGFWQFFLARLGVGIGEAGGVAPSYAIIGDYFPAIDEPWRFRSIRFAFPWGRPRACLPAGTSPRWSTGARLSWPSVPPVSSWRRYLNSACVMFRRRRSRESRRSCPSRP
ncbi:membrane hypothetical protein [Novosphingobium sp. 9U]|nr:membrane hypothetical protein [Novosphingobium sp. 9U]